MVGQVDTVDLAAMGEQQRLEGVVILGLDNGVERLATTMFDASCRQKTGVDRVAEFRDNHEVANVRRLGLLTVSGAQESRSGIDRLSDRLDEPQLLVGLRRRCAARGQDADLVAAPGPTPGELHCLRGVALEVQAERATVGQGAGLPLNIVGQRRVALS